MRPNSCLGPEQRWQHQLQQLAEVQQLRRQLRLPNDRINSCQRNLDEWNLHDGKFLVRKKNNFFSSVEMEKDWLGDYWSKQQLIVCHKTASLTRCAGFLQNENSRQCHIVKINLADSFIAVMYGLKMNLNCCNLYRAEKIGRRHRSSLGL